jgi:hypothetical protein
MGKRMPGCSACPGRCRKTLTAVKKLRFHLPRPAGVKQPRRAKAPPPRSFHANGSGKAEERGICLPAPGCIRKMAAGRLLHANRGKLHSFGITAQPPPGRWRKAGRTKPAPGENKTGSGWKVHPPETSLSQAKPWGQPGKAIQKAQPGPWKGVFPCLLARSRPFTQRGCAQVQ